MDETTKRRLVGIAVISLLILIVAWWLPDRDDGQKRLNPETLPTETRVYDIKELGSSAQTGTDSAAAATDEPGDAPPPEISPDFGQALNEGATLAEPAPAEDSSPVEDIEPAPVTTTSTESKPQASEPAQPAAETESTESVAKAEPAEAAPASEPEPEPAAQPQPVADGDWLVQVGSYGKQANAESMRQKLAAKGYRVAVSSAEVSGTTYHRVRVGPYPTKADANTAAANLKQLLDQNVAVMSNTQ